MHFKVALAILIAKGLLTIREGNDLLSNIGTKFIPDDLEDIVSEIQPYLKNSKNTEIELREEIDYLKSELNNQMRGE